jgi:ribosomal protein S4
MVTSIHNDSVSTVITNTEFNIKIATDGFYKPPQRIIIFWLAWLGCNDTPIPTPTRACVARLERRLDNVIYRLGFASSRMQARQLVGHKWFTVNGRRMNISSMGVKVGDVITLKANKKEKTYLKTQSELLRNKTDVPAWLFIDTDKMEAKVVALPNRSDASNNVDAQLVVEYYSK